MAELAGNANVWSLVEEADRLNPQKEKKEKAKSKVPRSSSFTYPVGPQAPKKQVSIDQSTDGDEERKGSQSYSKGVKPFRALSEADSSSLICFDGEKEALRRRSIELGERSSSDLSPKKTRHRKLSVPAAYIGLATAPGNAVEMRRESTPDKMSRKFSQIQKKAKVVGKQGLQLLKKTGEVANKILIAQDSKESDEEEEEDRPPPPSMSASVDEPSDEFYDANSELPTLSDGADRNSVQDVEELKADPNIDSGIGLPKERSISPQGIIANAERTFSASIFDQRIGDLECSLADRSDAEGSPPKFVFVYEYDPNCPVHGASVPRRRKSGVNSLNINLEEMRRMEQVCRPPQMKLVEKPEPDLPAEDVDDGTDDGKPRREILRRRASLLDTLDFGIGEDSKFPILTGQGFAAKLARKRQRATLTGEQKRRCEKEKSKIKWNLFVISVAFLFLFTAFHGLQVSVNLSFLILYATFSNLQTSVNDELGAFSLAGVYFGLAASSLFLPPFMVNRIGCKMTLIASMLTFTLYMLVNFVPSFHSMIPASLLIGAAAACLWASKCIYLVETGIRYATVNIEAPHVVIVRFFGIFFMIVHLGQVFGNILSSYLLSITMDIETSVDDRFEETCGHFFGQTNRSAQAVNNLLQPSEGAYRAVCGAYVCCTLVAAFIIVMFLNSLRRDTIVKAEKPKFRLDVWWETVNILKKPKPLLLIPLTIFNGMEQAFIVGEFTKAYVGCCIGISHIGYVMSSFGAADAICSLVFGPLIKLFGRMPLFVFGAVVDMLMIFTLLLWPPNPGDIAILYAIATCWGMADGVWNTQINGFWVALVGQNLEAAFGNYRMWESVGFLLSMLYTPYTTTQTKLILLLVALMLGMTGYALIELWESLTLTCRRLGWAMSDAYTDWKSSRRPKQRFLNDESASPSPDLDSPPPTATLGSANPVAVSFASEKA